MAATNFSSILHIFVFNSLLEKKKIYFSSSTELLSLINAYCCIIILIDMLYIPLFGFNHALTIYQSPTDP